MNKDKLKKAGLKITMPRMIVMELLNNSPDIHISAEDVYRKLSDSGEEVGLATIYRVLTQFEQAGLVKRHNFGSGSGSGSGSAIFELNDGQHHDHMLCMKCNSVIEFSNKKIEELQQQVADKHNFKLEDHAMTLYGVCNECKG